MCSVTAGSSPADLPAASQTASRIGFGQCVDDGDLGLHRDAVVAERDEDGVMLLFQALPPVSPPPA
jgi:hypothetical protein